MLRWLLLPESVAQSDGIAIIADCGVAARGERGMGAAAGSKDSEGGRSLPCMMMAGLGGSGRYYCIDAVPRQKVFRNADVVADDSATWPVLAPPFVVHANIDNIIQAR